VRPTPPRSRAALAGGLRLHKFKAQATLPRVRRVLGLLRGLAAATLLDAGSGAARSCGSCSPTPRWPRSPSRRRSNDARRARDLGASRAAASRASPSARRRRRRAAVRDRAFDTTTALEILEHLTDPDRAAHEILRVSRRHVVVSVPSHDDDNPGHIQRFDARALEGMLKRAGARRVPSSTSSTTSSPSPPR
jgi:hypothetical protein